MNFHDCKCVWVSPGTPLTALHTALGAMKWHGSVCARSARVCVCVCVLMERDDVGEPKLQWAQSTDRWLCAVSVLPPADYIPCALEHPLWSETCSVIGTSVLVVTECVRVRSCVCVRARVAQGNGKDSHCQVVCALGCQSGSAVPCFLASCSLQRCAPVPTERRLVADGHDCSLTVSGLTRFYGRPVPVLLLFLLGFGRFASSARARVCACVRVLLSPAPRHDVGATPKMASGDNTTEGGAAPSSAGRLEMP